MKTVFVQTLIQAVLPHKVVAGRKIQETLMLSNNVAHIAVEWIFEDRPRRYALTAVSLFINNKDKLASYKFVHEYAAELYASYPLWASTLLTTGAELDRVLKRFTAFSGELTQALIVLTEQEVREILDGQSVDTARRIIPAHWQNVMPERFSDWLEGLEDKARGVDEAKAALEAQLKWHRDVLERVRKFYKDHPFGEYCELDSAKKDLENNLEIQEKQRRGLLEAQVKVEEALATGKDARRLAESELERLAFCLKQAERYFSLQDAHRNLVKSREILRRRRGEIEDRIGWAEKEKILQSEVGANLKYERQILQGEKNRVKGLKFYDEVQSTDAAHSHFTYEMLAQARQLILDRLEGKQHDRGRIQAELEHAKADRNRLTRELDELKARVETALDEAFDYPANGAEKSNALLGEIRELKRVVKSLDAEREQGYAQYMKAEGGYKTPVYGRYHEAPRRRPVPRRTR